VDGLRRRTRVRGPDPQASGGRALDWLRRFGPKSLVLSFLPVVGDPLCAVAGWLKLPFWPCVGWMALGKFGRYLVWTLLAVWVFPEHFAH
jgi:membrane protein YqaA with SNARE-associated domain